MIGFFRKIRKQLAGDNKPLKYARYAIGEIVLVMIGILLALQVNNWNINKQETKELHSYLNSIKNNLKSDLISIEEIKLFRESSIAYSKNYLKIVKKDNITIEDYNTLENLKLRSSVFIDTYFKSKKSGFEALKNSGFIRRLNGTDLEAELNEYYYLIEKISDQETSLNNTIEALENVAYQENVRQRMIDISWMKNKDAFFSSHQKEIRDLLNHPSMTGANRRNAVETRLPKYYQAALTIANSLISEIDTIIQNQKSN
ncbi:DUF6090 family protein [uncultured Eudoraea sp.]|uniref:DUF6090 family protein n=1 Tax=uncultured Eudoraea sp. TaxID=1035614 RepID=UPI0026381BC1|nr:DUF6090 family protein [uncultured Eudoraea sp.]